MPIEFCIASCVQRICFDVSSLCNKLSVIVQE